MLTLQLLSGQEEKRECNSEEELETEERKVWLSTKREYGERCM